MSRFILGFAALFLAAHVAPVVAQPATTTSPATQPVDRVALEKQFEQTLTNAVLVGHFTATGSDAPPREDRYEIVKVTKQAGNNWLFQAAMRYAGKDLVIPLVIPVEWAGDTAVIQVTDMRIPGGGTYGARVMIFRDQYAGTWSSPKHGGHLFGRIERKPPAGADVPKPDATNLSD